MARLKASEIMEMYKNDRYQLAKLDRERKEFVAFFSNNDGYYTIYKKNNTYGFKIGEDPLIGPYDCYEKCLDACLTDYIYIEDDEED